MPGTLCFARSSRVVRPLVVRALSSSSRPEVPKSSSLAHSDGGGKPRILIVGGVAGGASAAARARRLSEAAEIIVYEKGPYVSFANCGLPYYVGDVIKEESKLLVSSPEVFRNRFNVEVQTCAEVTAVDPQSRTVSVRYADGHEVEQLYDKLILSPGARAIKPPIPGIDLPGIFTLRTIPDSRQVKEWIEANNAKSAVVVGGGFIGMEMAENLVELGLKVTLVEGAGQIIPPMDADMVVPMQQAAEAAGVTMALNQMVQSFSAVEGSKTIKVGTSTGDSHEGDVVILGMGVKPCIELAESANLTIGKKGGIFVDEHMRTSDPNIYAAGDVVETVDFVTGERVVLPLAGPANRQGRICADNALMDFFEGEDTPADGGDVAAAWASRTRPSFRGVQGTAVCGAFGIVAATTGASEKTLKRLGIEYDAVKLHPVHHVGYYPGAKPIHIKLVFAKADGRVLGAQAVGAEGAERRIDVFAAAIQAKQTVYDLEEMELCYSPQFGAAKDPVNMAGMIAANHLRGDSPVIDWESELELLEDEGANRESLLVDVREAGEFASEKIPGAMNIPLSQLRERVKELAETADGRRVHVHCGVGLRAYYATRVMRMNGIDAYNLTGGMTSYKYAKSAYGK